jgi:hypothetical protein
MSDGWDKWYRIRRETRPIHGTAAAGAQESDALRYLLPILLIGIVAAAVILAWQLYSYLRFGAWPALSIVTLLNLLQIGWAQAPRDWIGLHALLDAIPLSAAAFAGGILPIGLWLWRDGRSNAKETIDWGE